MKPKMFKVYGVMTKDNKDMFLTLVTKKEQAIEYVEKVLRLTHWSHYISWCNLREYDAKNTEAWDKYFTNCITYEEKQEYLITEIKYSLDSMVSCLRMFGGCTPIGCSFDTPVEINYYKEKIKQSEEDQKLAKEITDKLVKANEIKTAAEQIKDMENDEVEEDGE